MSDEILELPLDNDDVDFERTKSGGIIISQKNVRIAVMKMGVTIRFDRFADRMVIDGLPEFGPVLDDAAMRRIRLTMDLRWKLLPPKEFFFDVIEDMARLHAFHPVCDYLDSLKWDNTARLDKWLTTYGGAEDTPYSNAVGKLTLIAAVRRVRQPGCKFDEMAVLEGPQGILKSTALQTLAVKPEWFLDDFPLNLRGKEVIEVLRGRWIVEAAELSKLSTAETDQVKALLSRQVDSGRMSYDRLTKNAPRQCVFYGTTNEGGGYLNDTTGNRRWWPLAVQLFNIPALASDRDQLWAEAAEREAKGESIRLAEVLWPAAAEQQEDRTTQDPYYELLHHELDEYVNARISSKAVWTILDVKGNVTQTHNRRMGAAMRKLGWRRPNKGKNVIIDRKSVLGFVKGEEPWDTVVRAERNPGLWVGEYGERGEHKDNKEPIGAPQPRPVEGKVVPLRGKVEKD